MNRAEQEDFAIGFVYGLFTIPFAGLWAIPLAILSGIFWELGGTHGHSIRVFGCTAVLYLPAIVKVGLVGLIPAVIGAIVLSCGYGIPSENPPDEGSALGRFWFKVCAGNEWLTNLLTRGTIYLGLILCYLPMYFLHS